MADARGTSSAATEPPLHIEYLRFFSGSPRIHAGELGFEAERHKRVSFFPAFAAGLWRNGRRIFLICLRAYKRKWSLLLSDFNEYFRRAAI
jgi:hypothetical protein